MHRSVVIIIEDTILVILGPCVFVVPEVSNEPRDMVTIEPAPTGQRLRGVFQYARYAYLNNAYAVCTSFTRLVLASTYVFCLCARPRSLRARPLSPLVVATSLASRCLSLQVIECYVRFIHPLLS